ncbi:MAG TPA: CaiB/BaiF CoA-transferase family protein [Thermoanaerobaculia bacterium]|nr:CaiB/BaiF CoA-transferase family protein [Thermoanaerobaculia bacterium]
MAAPLAGTVVADLSRHLPGPLAGRLLADLGARVIKVEEPSQGDPVRSAPPIREGTGALAAILLSGLESIALDLKQPGGREVLDRLLARADVLLESFRPGTLARLGFSPGELRTRFPRLVVCSVSGWGQTGPYNARAGHDLTYQAVAGTLASTASMPAVPVADLVGAWSAVTSILAALLERERTGQGRHLDAALFDAATHANIVGWAMEAGGRKAVGQRLPLTGALPCYNLYQTADGGFVALAALEPHFWQRFCQAVGEPNLLVSQYSSSARVRREMEELFRTRTRGEWMALLGREDIPAEAVLPASEARFHPQAQERGLLSLLPGGLSRLAFPALFDGERPQGGREVPRLGHHTDDLLEELGVSRGKGVGPRFSWKRWLVRLFS